METISPQTFCYTKVKVGPKTIRPQDVSALHVSWTFQTEGYFNPPKDVLHQTMSAPTHSGTKTSLTFSESLGRAGYTGGDGSVGYVRGGNGIRGRGRREEMGGEGRGGEGRGVSSRIGY